MSNDPRPEFFEATGPPRSRFPGDASADRWATREKPEIVTIRCGRGSGCDRLVSIHETPTGPIVVFYRHATDRSFRFDVAVSELWSPKLPHKSFDRAAGTGRMTGRRDRGTVVSLEDDDYWSDIVTGSCRRHVGVWEFSRAELMDLVRRARQDGRQLRVSKR